VNVVVSAVLKKPGTDMRSSILLGMVCVVLSACSPALTPQESKFSNGDQVVCRYVVPVGSHLKERVCTTLSANKEESNQAKAVLEQAQHRRAADALLQRSGRRAEGP
jgi:hypothetical protein